jgi:SAM-dependent methyltransferase
MRLLDVGCGPGSITAGLAEAVTPGLAVGIDFDPARVEGKPITVASARGEQLPFADASFDAVFACAVLQHVPDPAAIVREMRRVARPGAVVALADADWDGYLVHPPDPLLDRGQDVLRALRSIGDPTVGKRLRDLLATNGFAEAVATAKPSSDGGAGAEAAGGFRAASFEAPSAVALAESLGVSTPDEMAAIAAAWRRWGASPGAFFAGFWIEALAWVPADEAAT